MLVMTNSIRLPNALVIGAPRSGTTSLFFYLKQHPEIYLPVRKELHYFSYQFLSLNQNGPGDSDALLPLCSNQEDYRAFYNGVRHEPVIVEVSPSYLYYSQVRYKIMEELGTVKIIAILRNPIDKAYSQYMHLVRLNLEKLSFFEALEMESERRRAGWGDIWRYAESSLYVERVKAYQETFGHDNVKILLFEDLAMKPVAVMVDLFNFLSVNPAFEPDVSRVYNRSGRPRSTTISHFFARENLLKSVLKKVIPERIRVPLRLAILSANSGEKGSVDEESYAYLRAYFQEDVAALERLLGRSTGWLRTETYEHN